MIIYVGGDCLGNIYDDNAKTIKAISDPSKLKIVDILSCGEKCASDLLEHFNFTQPTLSHHMKVLTECGVVDVKKTGLWNHYFLNKENYNKLVMFLVKLMKNNEGCICEVNWR